MAKVTFDLQEQLAKSIKAATDLPIKVAYLAPDDAIGIVPSPGSHKVNEDFDGLQYWSYNYAITIKSNHARDAKDKLFAISNFLNDVGKHEIVSATGSFSFDYIEVSSAPAEIQEELSGESIYELNFTAFVYRQRG